MITINGYQVNTKVYESSNSIVYQGIRDNDHQSVIIKVLKQDYPTESELTRYKQEYQLNHSLNFAGVIKAYELQKYHSTLVIIFEDFGGNSLKNWLTKRQVTLEEFLKLAIQITNSLGAIHGVNIIHKDINPSNIIYNPDTGEIKLIDFGISTQLLRETPTLKNPHVLEGTLAYISPEQTGRMNRCLDYRTDFYSLGVTFYELLTGKLPFETTEPMELVHCHLAKQPIPPHQQQSLTLTSPQIPQLLSDIVLKLMAKTAEERYQSAWGIKADLEECLKQLQTTGKIPPFSLGTQDISETFHIPQKLYGREQEVQMLLAAFERVAAIATSNNEQHQKSNFSSRPVQNLSNPRSRTEMMLVSGYSGIGKSALVREIYKPVTRQRGYFISGKFDQFQRNIPYSAIVSAFSSLVQQLLSEPEDQLNQWREKLLAVLNPNGQVIIDVIPEVELIIGKQPTVATLAPTETQHRFNLVFQNFIKLFCAQDHPLVIFLDDLQWADTGTLKLIELIMTNEETEYLLLIGAYRDNEVNTTHPFMLTLDKLGELGVTFEQITLAPLQENQINQLIVDTLQAEPDSVIPLAKLVVNKTAGNPFFVNQFLQTLYSENLLRFKAPEDGHQAQWQWDISEIEAVGITDNVVELMVRKLKKLPVTTQKVLQLAACVGNYFNLTTLSIVYEKSLTDTFRHLLSAIQEGFVLPTSDLKTSDQEIIESQLVILNFKFLHDRVQQAAYGLINQEDKTKVHLRIGRLLRTNLSETEREERVFELVNHLNVAQDAIADPTERTDLAQLNLEAGKKARENIAYGAAKDYFKLGIAYLDDNAWETHYSVTYALYKQLAETEQFDNNFEEADRLINLLLSRVESVVDKADIYWLSIRQQTVISQEHRAIEIGKQALPLLGIDWPKPDQLKTISVYLESARQQINHKTQGQALSVLLNEPEAKDLIQKKIIKLLNCLLPPSYITKQNQLHFWLGSKIVELSCQYGMVAESAFGFLVYGMLLTTELGDYQLGYEVGWLGLNLSKRFNQLDKVAQTCYTFANNLLPWVNPLKESDQILDEGIQAAFASGNAMFLGYLVIYKVINPFYWGKNLSKILEELPEYLGLAQKTQNRLAEDSILALKLFLYNLLGKTRDKFSFDIEDLTESQYLENCHCDHGDYALCHYYILKSIFLYWYDQPRQSLDYSEKAEKLIAVLTNKFQVAVKGFYESLSLASLYPSASEVDKKHYWQQLLTNQEKMKRWADNCPENFQHKYLLVAAEMARLSGQHLEAMELYDQAIASAEDNGFIQNQALANELAAKFWLSRGKEEIAQLYINKAHYSYQLWGARRKVEDLEQKYPDLLVNRTQQSSVSSTQTISSTTTSSTRSDLILDLNTVVKASQTISGEIVLADLLNKLIEIVVENAGAQFGCLILQRDHQLFIEATKEVEGVDQTRLQSIPVATSEQLPKALINYVARTGENLVLNDAGADSKFANDPYLQTRQPKSVLCSPILNQGKLVGILYLENNLTPGAFTPDRLEVLNLLTSQAAISLENAQLYEQLEALAQSLQVKVDERTQDLQKALQAAEVANQAKSDFLSNMSHELRTPLNGILGYAQILMRDRNFNPRQTNGLKTIYQSGNHLLTLINDLLDIAKIEAGKMELYPTDCHLPTFLEEVVGIIGMRALEKDILFKYQPGDNLPSGIQVDQKRMRQILLNLLGNAVKFTDRGQVSFKVSVLNNQNVGVKHQVNHPQTLRFEVIDTGVGMTQKQLETIFQPFEQVGDIHNRADGTGLGLTISQKLIDLMKGKLNLKSELGKGSTFWLDVTFPTLEIALKTEQNLVGQVIGYQGITRKILVVDDKLENRAVLQNMLEPLGFEVILGNNGLEEVQLACQIQPDLILTDLVMPVKTGFEAVQEIRQIPQIQNITIVAVSTSIWEMDETKSRIAGCDNFISKPVDQLQLLEVLEQHLALEWIYEDTAARQKSDIQSVANPSKEDSLEKVLNESFIIPPNSEMEVLYELAMLGSMRKICERAVYLEELDEKYLPFANKLKELAQDFQEAEILALVEKNLSMSNSN